MEKHVFNIAGHYLRVEYRNDDNMQMYVPSFAPFISHDEPDDVLTSVVVDDAQNQIERAEEVGQFDCGGAMFGVFRTSDDGYVFDLHDISGVLCGCLVTNGDFSTALVVLQPVSRGQRAYALNNAMMLVYAYASADRGTLLMHASVIRNDNRGYLFLGPSGTGKSTHTRLWRENIPGSDLLNDDNPVVRFVDGRAIVYGSPWSGKTPCYRQLSVPIAGIIRLEQRPYNRIERTNTLESLGTMLISVSNMKWDTRVQNGILATISSVIGAVPVCLMGCLPDGDAARTSYNHFTKA